jgi:hypothetical protein
VTATKELLCRVAALDAQADDTAQPPTPADDLERFIDALQQVVAPGAPPVVHGATALNPLDADRILSDSQLLARLAATLPSLATGPLDRATQFWIATGKPNHLPPGDPVPRPEAFVPAAKAAWPPPAGPGGVKPFGCGLFTSTAALGGYGMWWRYLQPYSRSSLFPQPWRVWRLEPRPDAVVYEVDTAAAWTALLDTYPRAHQDLIYPDWPAVAAHYDAVHLTLHGIAATQGLNLTTRNGNTAAAYWDIESTFWLTWSFTSAEPVSPANG